MSLWIIELFIMLVLILIASQLFTNALEHFGHKIKLSAGVTGSIFAAVATALPETMIPILAIVAGTSNTTVNQEVSVGAILGAPLMLSTLSTFLMAVSVIRQRGLFGRITPEKSGFTRDLNFFLLAFSLAAGAMFVPLEPVYLRAGISLTLILIYLSYLYLTCKASRNLVSHGYGVTVEDPLYITRLGMKYSLTSITTQLILGLLLLLIGAKGFIDGVENLSHILNISVLLISLIIIPIATELPEKVNSIMWVRKNKDTLGFGNISGAMVFQGTLLPALGILLTPWSPSREVVLGLIMTYLAAIWLRINTSTRGLSIAALLLNGILYFLYLGLALRWF
jgi:cation:H+ antiporter